MVWVSVGFFSNTKSPLHKTNFVLNAHLDPLRKDSLAEFTGNLKLVYKVLTRAICFNYYTSFFFSTRTSWCEHCLC